MRCIVLQIGALLFLLVALSVSGCGADSQQINETVQGLDTTDSPAADFGVVPLSEIQSQRAVSEEVITCAGGEFLPEFAQLVTANAGAAEFTPQWLAANPQPDKLAIAIYRFYVSTPSEIRRIDLDWVSLPGINGRIWLGLSYWQQAGWEWQPEPVQSHVDLGPGGASDYCREESGEMLVAIVLTGSQPAELGNLSASPNLPPVAILEADTTAGAGTVNVNFDASASSDPDGSIIKYEWDWNGSGSGPWDSSGPTPYASHTYSSAGSYTVWLRVTDNNGSTSLASCGITVLQGGDAWPMFGHDPSGRRRSMQTGPDSSNLLWKFWTNGPGTGFGGAVVAQDGMIYATGYFDLYALYPDGSIKWVVEDVTPTTLPALGPTGTIYFGTDNGELLAVSPAGEQQWGITVSDLMLSSAPAVGLNGTIAITTSNGHLFAVDPAGNILWERGDHDISFAGNISPGVGPDGSVYASEPNYYMHAYSPDGELAWTDYSSGTVGEPVVAPDGTIYSVRGDGRLRALNPAGEEIWSCDLPYGPRPPVIGSNGNLYLFSSEELFAVSPAGAVLWSKPGKGGWLKPAFTADGTVISSTYLDGVYAFAANGSQLWHYQDGGEYVTIPVAAPNGNILLTRTFQPSFKSLLCLDGSGGKVWEVGTGSWVRSSPVQDSNGTVYFGCFDNHIYAVNVDGSLKWRYEVGDIVESAPAVDENGTSYFSCRDGYLYAMNPDGSLKWKSITSPGPISGSPVIDQNGRIYVGAGSLFSINSDGSRNWFLPLSIDESSPAIGSDGTIYVGSQDSFLYAVDPAGFVKWSFEGVGYAYTPAVASDGTIYFGCYGRKLYAVKPDGELRWSYTTGPSGDAWISTAPAVDSDGTVYVTCHDHNLHAVSSAGDLKWKYAAGNALWTSPAVDASGNVYFSDQDGIVYGVTKQGGLKWEYAMGGDSFSSPIVGIGGTILIGSDDGKLHAIGGG